MKKLLSILFFALFFPLWLYAQSEADEGKRVETSVNFGAKAGFTSAMMLVDELNVSGTDIGKIQNHYKIGYFASLFMRINFDRHFLQPELSYNINRCSINFDKPLAEGSGKSNAPQTSSIHSKLHSVEVPIIYGYNIVKEDPYSLAVFGGPKLRYIWNHKSKTEFTNFDETNIEESFYPLNAAFTLGVAVTISRIFFDFRYDIGMLNLSDKLYSGEESADIDFKHRENALSFSLGVFF